MVAARYNILYSAEIMLFYTLSARYRLLILLDIGIHRVFQGYTREPGCSNKSNIPVRA